MSTELGCTLWALILNQGPIWNKKRKNHSIKRMYANTCLNIRQISAQHIGINGDLWSGMTWWQNLNIDIDECPLCCRSNSYNIESIFFTYFSNHISTSAKCTVTWDLGPISAKPPMSVTRDGRTEWNGTVVDISMRRLQMKLDYDIWESSHVLFIM